MHLMTLSTSEIYLQVYVIVISKKNGGGGGRGRGGAVNWLKQVETSGNIDAKRCLFAN